MTMRTALLSIATFGLAAACSQSAPAPTTPKTITLEAVSAFPGPNTGQPQLHSSARGALVSWVERAGKTATLKYAEHTTAGWSAAKTVTSGTDWFVNDADVPGVMRLPDGTLVANWLQEVDPFLEAYNLWLTQSKDDGATWSQSVSPHHDGTKTQHGFASLFPTPSGGAGVIWLDGRQFALDPEAADGGSMALRSATFDGSGKQTSEAEVVRRACECCQTSTATTADGPLVAYRGRSDREIRDIFVSRLENGKWTAPVTVHADNWEVYACPVNGPAVAANGRTAAVAWFTGVGNAGHAWLAFSSDAGRTWGMPVRLDEGEAVGRVDVELLPDGSAVALYVEFVDGREEVRMKHVTPNLATSPAAVLEGSGRLRGSPRMALSGEDLVVAWTESAGGDQSEPVSAVQTIVAHLSAGK